MTTNFLLENWGELLIGLLAFIKIIVNLTPTDKDNEVFSKIDGIINFLIRDNVRGRKN